MRKPTIAVVVEPHVHEEIQRLAKSHKTSPSDVVRHLIDDALARRAEESTASQFQMVENRLAYMESRFSAWMIKVARAAAEGLFYSEQIALADADPKSHKAIKDAADVFVRDFMKTKTKRVGSEESEES